jgi:type 1 glutamine amidotransferase
MNAAKFLSKTLASLLAIAVIVAPRARAADAPPKPKEIVFIAGAKSHGEGEHEYEKGSRLLAAALESSTSLSNIHTKVIVNGWPAADSELDGADCVVLYCDGADHRPNDHPLLRPGHLETMERLVKRGAGLVVLHYTIIVPKDLGGPQLLDWAGGYFDYQSGKGRNNWLSKIEMKEYTVHPLHPLHPVSRGLESFSLREEYYFNLVFPQNSPGWTPILSFGGNDESPDHVVAWAFENAEGHRGFGYSGGHFHSNWSNPNARRLALNAIAWTAKIEIPPGGVESKPPKE